jgi:hypothetical protein
MASSPTTLAASEITSRYLDPERHVREFSAVAEFHRKAGIPGIGPDWFHRVGRAAWQARNPGVYRVYLREGRIAGCSAVAPLRPACVEALLAGRRSLWWEVTADDLLEPAEHDRARFFGCTLLMEAYKCGRLRHRLQSVIFFPTC